VSAADAAARGEEMSVADAAARRRAQTEFDGPLLLEAGAGTGKTAVLVARVVAWCLGPGWERVNAAETRPSVRAAAVLRRVVAITFTETATAEMAERIARAFEDVRQGRLPVGVLEEALPPPSVREVRAAAFRLALDQLRVNTIHAFCLRLLLAYPLEAGVHPRLTVDADGQAVAAAAREVLEEQLPAAYGDEPDAAHSHLADEGIGPRELEAALVTLLAEGAVPEDLASEAREAARASDFVVLLRDALAALLAVEGGRLASLARAPAVAAAAGALATAGDCVARARVRDARDLAALAAELTSIPEWKRVPEHLRTCARDALGDAARKALGADTASLARRAEALRPLLDHLTRLDLPSWVAARSVLHGLLVDVHARLRRRGVATFGGLLRGARDLLRDPEVRARVRGELDQLLVDEFQDTDALQCEILHALALGTGEARGPALFLVGDPKQSIYGWRNADLRAYEEIRKPLAAAGRVEPLVVNFRSVPAILAEVARAVGPVMEETPGIQPAFAPLVTWAENEGRDGYSEGGRAAVEHWLPARHDAATGALVTGGPRELLAEREARAVAADVADLAARGVPLDRVAILLRATGDFERVLAALRERGVPYVVERETEFYQRREIQDAVALVRCVLDPLDALALVATLRSSVAGVPDAAWLPLWHALLPARASGIDGADPQRLEDARAAVRAAAAAMPADVPEVERVALWPEAAIAFLEALHELRGAFASETPERFVERLRECVALEASEAARYLGGHRVANLDRFFRDLVQALEQAAGSAASVVAFLRRAGSLPREHQEGRPRAATHEAVHVLSIHRAKGLDWEHVYLLATDRGPGRDDRRASRIERRGGDVGFVLLGWPEPGLPVLAAERALVDAAERVRLLYVATTRAKQRLVIGTRDVAAVEWRRANTQAALLAHRPGPAGWPAAVTQTDALCLRDEHHALWRVVDPPEPVRAQVVRGAASLPDAERLAREHDQLCALREGAAVRAARVFSTTASAGEHTREERGAAAAGDDESPPRREGDGDDAERRVALAAGTAVHAVLEGSDWSDAALERAVESAAPPGERAAVRGHARAVWGRFAAGPLAARLAALGPHVVARELPVWTLPAGAGEGEPVGFVAGAIDLLYRDPESGRLVVADYKTDAVDGADLAAHAARYAGQGAAYVRAVAGALGLPEPPRFELWFLQAGIVWPAL
jgi:ATP-dependent helicase/nuclease subunit A